MTIRGLDEAVTVTVALRVVVCGGGHVSGIELRSRAAI